MNAPPNNLICEGFNLSNTNAYTEAVKIFKDSDPFTMVKNAGARYNREEQIIKVKYFDIEAEVFYPTGEIKYSASWNLVKNDKVLILQYLVSACGVPPRGTWISFLQLPDGPHHHVPFIQEAITPLAEEFGNRIDEFKQRVKILGATEINIGDYGVTIPVFPYLPLAVCLWRGDEEFAASSNILFDVTASLHLSTAALWVSGVEVSRKIRGVVGQQYSD